MTDAGSDSAEVQLKVIKSDVQSAYETIQVSFSRFFGIILLYALHTLYILHFFLGDDNCLPEQRHF